MFLIDVFNPPPGRGPTTHYAPERVERARPFPPPSAGAARGASIRPSVQSRYGAASGTRPPRRLGGVGAVRLHLRWGGDASLTVFV